MSGEVYYIVFTDDDGHWWSSLLHKTIRHCYVIKPDRGRWLIMARSTDGIDLYTADDLSFIDPGSLLVKFYAERAKIGMLSFTTCVTYCKHVLGIRKWWIITPYQLYRWINETFIAEQTKPYVSHSEGGRDGDEVCEPKIID